MTRDEIIGTIRDRAFKTGIALQILSAFGIATLLLAIRLNWIDVIEIGLRNGIDKPSPGLTFLYWTVYILIATFALGFVFYALAIFRCKKSQCPKGRDT
jgi:hypothetical protein